jgi:citrate lyase subunit beta/citryl-CoA lyase
MGLKTMTSRKVTRSGLMMPINNKRFVDGSWTREADSLNYDLEDSVPQSQKAYARSIVRETLQIPQKGGAQVTIRINCSTPEADVDASVWPPLASISHPKTEDPEQIRRIDALITRLEWERGIRPGTVEINAMIETAKGIAQCYEIAASSPRVTHFAGGGGYDMSLDLGVEMFQDFDQFLYGKGECSLAARALGLEPGISLFMPETSGSVMDGEGTLARAVAHRKAGSRSSGGLHPNVVPPTNRGLTPEPEEVDQAQRIVAFFRQLDERGDAEGMLDGQVVDRYEAARAEELIDWAAACTEKDAYKERMVQQTRESERMVTAS